jgi:hypothetical protein
MAQGKEVLAWRERLPKQIWRPDSYRQCGQDLCPGERDFCLRNMALDVVWRWEKRNRKGTDQVISRLRLQGRDVARGG